MVPKPGDVIGGVTVVDMGNGGFLTNAKCHCGNLFSVSMRSLIVADRGNYMLSCGRCGSKNEVHHHGGGLFIDDGCATPTIVEVPK